MIIHVGPGGKIVSAAVETFWGRIILGILIAFLSLFIASILLRNACILLRDAYIWLRKKTTERRTRKDLQFMSEYDQKFDWLEIKERATDCFFRVHSGWQEEDLSKVSSWMTDWYWQNQQLLYLEKWKKEGLTNICTVEFIKTIKPLIFFHKNQKQEHEGSLVVILFTVRMQDFLRKRNTRIVVEGSEKFKKVSTIWSFKLINGAWKVSNIEDETMILDYILLTKVLPNIERTLISNLKA